MGMKYFFVEPEVAGGFGDRAIIDRSSGKMDVKKLHYEFDGWLGDELIESTPCFIVSKRLADKITSEKLTGGKFDDVEVTTSDEFQEFHQNRQLPEFVWFKVDGKPGEDDFGLTSELNLIVSEKALQLLLSGGISNAATVTPYQG